MLLRATNKLEAERTILAHRQFDLSASSAEENLKDIMEVINKMSKEGNKQFFSLFFSLLIKNLEKKESNPTSFYTCDEMINLAHGTQLLPQNSPEYQRIYQRTPQESDYDVTDVDDNNNNNQNNNNNNNNITLMEEKDLDDWLNWFYYEDDEDSNLIPQLGEIDEKGRSVRKSRSKVSLSESEIWKLVSVFIDYMCFSHVLLITTISRLYKKQD